MHIYIYTYMARTYTAAPFTLFFLDDKMKPKLGTGVTASGVTASNNLCFCCSPLLTTNQLKLKHPRKYTLVNTCKPSFSQTMHIKIENPSFQACLAAFYLVLLSSTYKLLINYLCLLMF
jgi:hypothetical protein